jgi:hypothetical protein
MSIGDFGNCDNLMIDSATEASGNGANLARRTMLGILKYPAPQGLCVQSQPRSVPGVGLRLSMAHAQGCEAVHKTVTTSLDSKTVVTSGSNLVVMRNAKKTAPIRAAAAVEAAARVEKDEPVHMMGMEDLIGLSVAIRQGDPFLAMRLDLDFNCGTGYLKVNEGEFVLCLPICFVGLQLQNCSVKEHTSYEYRLDAGEIDSLLTKTRDRAAGVSVEVGADAQGDVAAKTGLGGRFGLSGKFGAKRLNESTSKEVVRRRTRLDLVTRAGKNRWQIGDASSGDYRRPDARLHGSYFNEERDEHGDVKPLCTIIGGRREGVSIVTVEVLARVGQIIVEFAGQPAAFDEREDVEATLLKRSARAVLVRDRKVADLRSRVAGLAIAKAMQARQDPDRRPSDGEVLLAHQSIIAAPVVPSATEDRRS